MTDHTTSVVISGGGPVGMALAIELGQRNIDCIVVERHAQPLQIPRGQNLTQRTMEHFRFWGIEAELRQARTIPPEFGSGGMTTYGTLLGEYRHDWLQRELVRPFYAADNERLPQYATEAVLRTRAATLPSVRVMVGWSAEQAEQDENGVRLSIAERDTSSRATIRAAYAVGCDGSRSVLREQAGITQTLSDHDRVMVLLVFRSLELDRLMERFPGKSFFNVLHPDLQGYWRFFGRVDLNGSWFFHAPVPVGTTAENGDFAGMLQEAVGAEIDVTLLHVGFWDLRFAIADSYRQGRMFVAGDAAHSHPPYGGYGINTGFEDAVNLGWKLAAMLQGWGGPALLDSYDAERRPVFASTARDFIERAITEDRDFVAAFDPARDRHAFERRWAERASGAATDVNAFEPNYAGSPVVCGPANATPGAVGRHSFVARPGHHLAPQPSTHAGSTYDALNCGFTLLALDTDEAVAHQFAKAAEELRMPLSVVRDTRANGRERWEAAAVLVRPDQFIAWAGDGSTADAAAILKRAVGADA